jgi:hypothetical protein
VKNTFNKGPAAARCSIKENLEGRGVVGANPVFALTVAIKRIWANKSIKVEQIKILPLLTNYKHNDIVVS